jgi:pimeloyl-ACP methyl ester carboxylesterase
MGRRTGIYRSARGEAVVQRVYDAAVASLPVPVEHQAVSTRYGATHVLVTGPADGSPLVVLSGGNFPSPLSLRWFAPSLERYRVYAPDTVGHPGKSAQTRVSPRDDSYGWWLVDVLDALGLDQVALLGPSFGAGIILAAASVAPQRIGRAALVVPAGIVNPPVVDLLMRLALPMLAYRLRPDRARLVRAIRPLFTDDAIDEPVLEAVGAVFDHVRIEPVMPRARRPDELASLTAPVVVIAAEHDVLFPGGEVVARARRLFPNLEAADVMPGSAHVPSAAELDRLRGRLDAFLR